jgi:uncharacterized membrane protein SirB2
VSVLAYPALKLIHVTCAALSIGGYVARGGLMLRGSALLNARWVRTVPHAVDTLLLVSAIGLALMLHQYPIAQGWLTAKVIALVAYVVVGAIGLRYGRTRRVRIAAFVAAVAIFGYIVAVAVTHSASLGLF